MTTIATIRAYDRLQSSPNELTAEDRRVLREHVAGLQTKEMDGRGEPGDPPRDARAEHARVEHGAKKLSELVALMKTRPNEPATWGVLSAVVGFVAQMNRKNIERNLRLDAIERLVDGKSVRHIELRTMAFESRVARAEAREAKLESEVNSLTSNGATNTGTDAAHVRSLEARIVTLEQQLAERPGLKYLGLFQQGTTYREGDAITDRGGVWIARRTTDMRPGFGDAYSSAWTLALKEGRDGKDATR